MTFILGPEVQLDRPAFVDPTARIFGRVSAGEGSSFWPYSVIRAEGAGVRIGLHSKSMVVDERIGIVGARGYVGGELIRLLPQVEPRQMNIYAVYASRKHMPAALRSCESTPSAITSTTSLGRTAAVSAAMVCGTDIGGEPTAAWL